MNTLYSVNRDLERILFEINEADANGQTPDLALIEQLKAAVDTEGEKIDACCMFIKAAEAHIKAFKEHKEVVDTEIKRYQKAIQTLESVAFMTMNLRNIRELKGKHGHKFSLRKSQAVEILDPSLLPEKYLIKKEVITADKDQIKIDLKLGKEVTGATLVERENVQVK